MRAILCFAVLAVATPTAHADSFVDLLGGISIPMGDDDWTNAAESSPKLGLRVGAVPNEIGGFVQADWTPVNTDADGAFGGAVDVSAHRFRVGVGAMFHHPISNTLVVTGRGGLGIDIARVSGDALGFEFSDTDVGFGLEFGGGVFFRAGNLEIGGELGIPVGIHDHDASQDDIEMKWTSYDIDLLFCARFLSN